MSEPSPARAARARTSSARGRALRDRVSAAIVASAAEVLAERGAAANMADIAAAAGVARATVYRYFPTREALLERLVDAAVTDAGTRLEEARLGEVAPEEAVTRAVRALLEVGDAFRVLAREGMRPRADEYEQRLLSPLRRMVANAQKGGVFRDDIPTAWLTNALVDLVLSVAASTPALGRDDAVAAASGLFLDGARATTESSRGSVAITSRRRSS